MIRKLTAVVIVGWLGAVGVAQAAGDAAAGKAKAAVCAGCHGEKGEGVAPNPKLAGIPEADLLKALKDFKSGAKSSPIMNGIAATLSDQDMENFAAYYASFKQWLETRLTVTGRPETGLIAPDCSNLMMMLDWKVPAAIRMLRSKKQLLICDRDAIRAWIREGAKNN